MACIKKYELQIRKIRQAYSLFFVIYLLLARIVPFVNIIGQNVNGIIFNFMAIAGCVILFVDFLMTFFVFKNKENLILFAFLAVCGVSTLINIQYGITNNLKTIIWTAIHFYILFSGMYMSDKDEVKKLLNRVMIISSVIWFVATGISLFQFIFQVAYLAPFSEYPRRQGFIESRLFGVFSDPNFASVTSLVVIVFCLLLLKQCNRKSGKIYYVANIVFQIFYVILSGSRMAHLEFIMLSFIWGYFKERNRRCNNSSDRIIVGAFVKGCLCAIISVLFIVALPSPSISVATVGKEFRVSTFGEWGLDTELTLKREDIGDDASNGRVTIWLSALEVSSDHRVLGLSPRNLVPYAKANYPDSYIAQRGYETHNGYLAVFVGTGIVGTIVIMLFVLSVLRYLCLYVIRRKRIAYEDGIIAMFIVVLLISVSAVFLLDIFFVNTYSTAIFWLFLGALLCCLKSEIREEDCYGQIGKRDSACL